MRNLFAALFAVVILCGCQQAETYGEGSLTSITANKSRAEFAMDRGATVPEQIVELSYEGDYIVAGYPEDSPSLGWLRVEELPATEPGKARFRVLPEPWPEVLPGTYSTTLRFLAGRLSDAGGTTYSSYVDLPVQITIRNVLARGIHPAEPPMEFQGRYLLPNEDIRLIRLLAHGISWTAEPLQPWIQLDQTSGNGDAGILVRIDNLLADAGEQTGQVRIRDQASGDELLVTVKVTNSLPQINSTAETQEFQRVNGTNAQAPLFGGSLSTFQQAEWSVTTTTPWLRVVGPGFGGFPPNGSFLPHLNIDTRGLPIASGTHQGSYVLNAKLGKYTIQRSLPVRLVLIPPTISGPEDISISGLMSDELLSDIGLSLDTEEVPYTLRLAATGTGAAALVFPASIQASATSTPVRITLDRAKLPPGRHDFTFTVSADVNGDRIVRNIPLHVALEQNRLVPARSGVALRSLPVASRLSASLRIDDLASRGGYEFSTASTASWLSATPTADTGESISINADPSGLDEGFHEAELVLTPVAPGFARAERIRVGLYVGSQPPNDVSANVGSPVAVDPVAPYIYVGGIPPSGRGSVLSRVHLYTGEVTEFFTTTPDNIRGVQITPDGRTLLANVFHQGIITFDTRDLSRPPQPLPLFAVLNSAQFEQVEVAGRPFILGSDYTGRDLATNGDDFDLGPRMELRTCHLTVDSVQQFTASANGRYLVGDSGCVHEMRYSHLDNRLSLHRIENEDDFRTNVQVISDRGDRAFQLHSLSSEQTSFQIYDYTQGGKRIGQVLLPVRDVYVDSFFLTRDGREFHTLVPGREQVWVFSAEGDLLRQYVMRGTFIELRNSGDGARLIISGFGGFRATELP